ncbi:hypothetical protein PR202_gb20403 [Eleusine coracana subsp. coracana]|uniref:BPL/LPL catalytic domain-containing protein n=1 Tax=Eleusine coracana subsp. coracana TaxID=191504 RepID=A0AAV5FAE1_ELECO|nr:hypothetical protein PR202_gb20403 [Eleusine coracana subsp. coracana]
MALLSSLLPCSYHRTAPIPVATTSARPRRGSLRFAEAVRCLGPDAALRNSTLQLRPAAAVGSRRCDCFDLHQQIVPYADSWAWQKSIVMKRKGLVDKDEDFSDTLIALQHPSIYTLGTDSSEDYLHFNVQDPPFEIYRIDRGGEVTYHGPGQLNLKYGSIIRHFEIRIQLEIFVLLSPENV